MNLILEKTTGKLVPAGEPGRLARGGVQSLSLQFLDSGVAGLLAGGAPIALKLFELDDTDDPILSVTNWTADEDKLLYTATLDTLAGVLAWVQQKTYLARIDYADPTVASSLFHLVYGGAAAAPGTQAQVIQRDVTTVGQFPVVLKRTGNLSTTGAKSVFGYYYVEHAGRILGAQLAAENAPEGADVQVDLINAADEELGKVMTLSDGEKAERTVFAAPLNVSAGDVLRCKLLQVGSTKPGSYLLVNLICENT